MRLVIIESPYSGDTEINENYARKAMLDCLMRGEAPFASHLLYTQPGVLDDTNAVERTMGMEAGWSWMSAADAVVIYADLGISKGMAEGIRRARGMGKTIELRYLGLRNKNRVNLIGS